MLLSAIEWLVFTPRSGSVVQMTLTSSLAMSTASKDGDVLGQVWLVASETVLQGLGLRHEQFNPRLL